MSSAWEIDESRRFIFARDGGVCRVCGRPANQIAHRIPQRLVGRYGEDVIHHPWNLMAVCSLKCNDAVSISNHPQAIAELVAEIRGALEWDDMMRDQS